MELIQWTKKNLPSIVATILVITFCAIYWSIRGSIAEQYPELKLKIAVCFIMGVCAAAGACFGIIWQDWWTKVRVVSKAEQLISELGDGTEYINEGEEYMVAIRSQRNEILIVNFHMELKEAHTFSDALEKKLRRWKYKTEIFVIKMQPEWFEATSKYRLVLQSFENYNAVDHHGDKITLDDAIIRQRDENANLGSDKNQMYYMVSPRDWAIKGWTNHINTSIVVRR